MSTIRNINISAPVTGEEEWNAVKSPLISGWITSGPKVKEFENLFAEFHGVKHAFAVTSATTALHLSLVALGVGPGDEVIVPAFTWVSTANVVIYCGAKPVFVDIDLSTFNLSPRDLRNKITEKTKVIIPVHLFGLCADIDAIKSVAKNIPLVEDAACAAGASYKGKFAGNLGAIGCFSFHPRKSITTGEGGMVTTNNDNLADYISKLRNHGAEISEEQRHNGPKPYILPDFNILGYNYRMTDLQGAIGVVQIKKLKSLIDERQKWSNFYLDELKNIDWLELPTSPKHFAHGWQSFVTIINPDIAPKSRNQIMDILQKNGVSTRPGTHAVHMLNYYKNSMKIHENDFPNAKFANNNSMAIPLHNNMSKQDFEHVVNCIKSIR